MKPSKASLDAFAIDEFSRCHPLDEVLTDLKIKPLDLDRDPEFVAGYLKTQFAGLIADAMKTSRISQGELARRMGVSRQYVHKILAEDESVNFTLETIAAILCALELHLNLGVSALPPAVKAAARASAAIARRAPAAARKTAKAAAPPASVSRRRPVANRPAQSHRKTQ